ncbi:four helix bundle protein [Patescibacteria group bacterium]|nr:four helix bundle protein [Patescibacteria group bacterium]
MKTYKNLTVWQKSIDLVDEIYLLTNKFPDSERFGLVSQMRRAAVSIPSNIAEGYRRNSDGSYIQFLSIAFGSGAELETQLEIAKRNMLMNESEYKKVEQLLEMVMKMLNVLLRKLRSLKVSFPPLPTAHGLRAKRGIAALPLVIMIGGLVIEIAVALLVGNALTSKTELNARLNAQALAAAQSGIQDAMLRIARDKTFSGQYALSFPDGSIANVTVCADQPAPNCVGLNKDQIISLGSMQNRTHQLKAILDVNQATGEVKVESLSEVAYGILTQSGTNAISGWAYSNLGWISFSCSNQGSCGTSNYGVTVNATTGVMDGYAWSDVLGWISFTASDLVGCPSGTCNATIPGGLTGTFPKTLTGWAKVMGSGSWIHLAGTALDNSSYGVSIDSGGRFSGWSWDDADLGWMHWGDVYYYVHTN